MLKLTTYYFVSKYPPSPEDEELLNYLTDAGVTFVQNIEDADVVIFGESNKSKIHLMGKYNKDKKVIKEFTGAKNYMEREFFI